MNSIYQDILFWEAEEHRRKETEKYHHTTHEGDITTITCWTKWLVQCYGCRIREKRLIFKITDDKKLKKRREKGHFFCKHCNKISTGYVYVNAMDLKYKD